MWRHLSHSSKTPTILCSQYFSKYRNTQRHYCETFKGVMFEISEILAPQEGRQPKKA